MDFKVSYEAVCDFADMEDAQKSRGDDRHDGCTCVSFAAIDVDSDGRQCKAYVNIVASI